MNRTITTLVLFVTLGLSASTHAQVFGGSGPQSHDTVNFTVDAKFMMRFKVVAQDSNSGVTQYSATAGQVKLHVYGMLQNQSFNASTDVPFIFDEDHSRWSLTVTQSGRDVQVASESKLVVTNAEGETKETTDSFNSPGRADLKKRRHAQSLQG